MSQIRAFVRSAKVPRSQLLVLSFERLVSDHKVDVISCESRSVLQRLYGDWNQMLERGLRVDRNKGLSPPEEPAFHGFKFEVPCEDKERAVGIEWYGKLPS